MITKTEWSCQSLQCRTWCISWRDHEIWPLLFPDDLISCDMAHQTPPQTSEKWIFIKYWAPVLLYCGIIVYVSSLSYPSRNLPSFFSSLSDKLVHGVEYGILGILLYRALCHTTRINQTIRVAIFCAVVFGITDELHQWYVPHRHADLWDVVADTAGAIFFIAAWVFIMKK